MSLSELVVSMFLGFGQDQDCCWVYARVRDSQSHGPMLSPSDLVILGFGLCHVGDAHMVGSAGTRSSGRTIAPSTEALWGILKITAVIRHLRRIYISFPFGTEECDAISPTKHYQLSMNE